VTDRWLASLAHDTANASEESGPTRRRTPRDSRRARYGNDGGGRSGSGAACDSALATVSARATGDRLRRDERELFVACGHASIYAYGERGCGLKPMR